MSKMTIVHLGVIVFVVCLSTQVVSQNSTNTTGTASTSKNTTMAPGINSNPANSTTPTGAGVVLHAGIHSFLVPVIVAASLLQCYC